MSSRRIGNYQIIDYIGSGGFGSVFKAEDVNTPGRIIAIKELHKKHTRNSSIKQRFFQEAIAMARLDHPNLPRLAQKLPIKSSLCPKSQSYPSTPYSANRTEIEISNPTASFSTFSIETFLIPRSISAT